MLFIKIHQCFKIVPVFSEAAYVPKPPFFACYFFLYQLQGISDPHLGINQIPEPMIPCKKVIHIVRNNDFRHICSFSFHCKMNGIYNLLYIHFVTVTPPSQFQKKARRGRYGDVYGIKHFLSFHLQKFSFISINFV